MNDVLGEMSRYQSEHTIKKMWEVELMCSYALFSCGCALRNSPLDQSFFRFW